MRLSKSILLVVILACCSPANACLNDSELPDHEREFRSQYLTSPIVISATPDEHTDQLWLLSASGIALMAGAAGLTWYSRKTEIQP